MKMARKSKSISKIIVFVGLTSLLSSCSNNPLVEHRYYGFDTMIDFTYEGEKEYADTLVSPLNTLSDLFDTYKAIPGLINAYSINNAFDFLTVDKDLFDVLTYADAYYQDTNGIFNPLIKDVAELWKSAVSENSLPDETSLNSLMEKVELSSLEFSGIDKVRINGEAHIDLGGIAKGYALKKVKASLDGTEIKNYIVNAGNSSILLGENSQNNGLYRVGMRNTENLYLEINKTSIGTSSIYEQKYLQIGEKIYSHIINGLTGSAEVKNHMAVVLHDDPVLCDVYSTVAMVLDETQVKQIEAETGAKFILLSNGIVTYKNPQIEVKQR